MKLRGVGVKEKKDNALKSVKTDLGLIWVLGLRVVDNGSV